ncbi:hypothetical protein ABFA25_14145 [Mycobacterium lepromatosis]|nr:hypothetical protein [Mycobacterium lepromatosis]
MSDAVQHFDDGFSVVSWLRHGHDHQSSGQLVFPLRETDHDVAAGPVVPPGGSPRAGTGSVNQACIVAFQQTLGRKWIQVNLAW